MKERERDPTRLLHDLLDRLERVPDRQRAVTARPSLVFADSEQKRRLEAGLEAAAGAGAVALEPDKEAPHLIGRVRLLEPAKLYAHLQRQPRSEQVTRGHEALAGVELASTEALRMRAWLIGCWLDGRSGAGIRPGDSAAGTALLRAAEAAFAPGALPLRARSAQLLGDSKLLEKALPRLFAAAREAGVLVGDRSDEDLRRDLGLERVPPSVEVAGPLTVGGQSIAEWTMVGLAPEQLDQIGFARPPRTLLTIENLESFHRHIRSARDSDDIVVYCGGYPSRSVITLLRRLKMLGVTRLHHWGDIDPAGLAIADLLAERSGLCLSLHLMTPELASRWGRPTGTGAGVMALVPGSPTSELKAYLLSAEAHQLEQELVEPQRVDELQPCSCVIG